MDSSREQVSFIPLASVADLIDRKKTVIITDARIESLYGRAFKDIPTCIVPEGEKAKSWDTLRELLSRFVDLRMDRSWTVLSMGGGTVSDLAGFAAHVWMRGIRFLCIPTTLLAMTDASLGGKNGIDFMGYKNVVGSFHRPAVLYCDVHTLRTLESVQFSSGMAEVIKHAVLDGEAYFSFLEESLNNSSASGKFDHRSCPDQTLIRMVAESQRVKLDIVDTDPEEKNLRRLLNLGHTFGHAIESATGLPHGHSVSLGLMLACRYSLRQGGMSETSITRIGRVLEGYGLPSHPGEAVDRSTRHRIAPILFMDKKRDGDFMNFVIPRDIGDVVVGKVPVRDLEQFLLEELA